MTKEEFNKLKAMALSENTADKELLLNTLACWEGYIPRLYLRWLCMKVFDSYGRLDDGLDIVALELRKAYKQTQYITRVVTTYWDGDTDHEPVAFKEYEDKVNQRKLAEICSTRGDI